MKQVLKFFKPCIPAILLIIALLFGQAMCELALPGYMSDIINDGIIKQFLFIQGSLKGAERYKKLSI